MTYSLSEPRRGLRLLGVNINIDTTWLVFAAFVGWQVATGQYAELQGLGRGAYVVVAILVVLGLSLSILVHEMSHTLTGRAFGMRINRITLYMFGGVAELDGEPRTAISELLMALAGPAMSVVIAIVLALAVEPLRPVAPPEVVLSLDYLAELNLMLALFNMIPAFPLDGGRVLRSLIWLFTRRAGLATRIAAFLGQGFGFAMMLFGAYVLFRGSWGSGLWYVILGGLLVKMARQGAQNAPIDAPR